jgi:hypothetical protein
LSVFIERRGGGILLHVVDACAVDDARGRMVAGKRITEMVMMNQFGAVRRKDDVAQERGRNWM